MPAGARSLAVLAALAVGALPVSAQQPRPSGTSIPPIDDSAIDISVQHSVVVPVERQEPEKQQEALQKARRMLYDIAASECAVLLATIASTCELKRFALHGQIPPHPGQQSTFAQMSGNATYRIKPKAREP